MVILLVYLTAAYGATAVIQPEKGPVADEAQIRWLLNAEKVKDLKGELAKAGGLGPAAFALYSRIISGSEDDAYVVARALYVIGLPEINGDRSQFVDLALGKLTDPRNGVRRPAVHLLGKIGTARDTTPVAVLLCDPDPSITRTAAETLAAIGDERSVAALEVWLKRGNHRDDEKLRRHVENAQADLIERLEKEKQAKAKKPPAK